MPNDRAVSPVVGVVLMVAITVILAAAVLTLTMGIQEPESPPQATFDAAVSNGTVTLTHTGGNAIEAEALAVRGADCTFTGTVTAGDQCSGPVQSDPIRIVWQSGDSSYVIYQTGV